MTTHIVVFSTFLSDARAKKIQRAVRKINRSAYCVSGWNDCGYQPGYVSVDGYVTDAERSALYDAAMATRAVL